MKKTTTKGCENERTAWLAEVLQRLEQHLAGVRVDVASRQRRIGELRRELDAAHDRGERFSIELSIAHETELAEAGARSAGWLTQHVEQQRRALLAHTHSPAAATGAAAINPAGPGRTRNKPRGRARHEVRTR